MIRIALPYIYNLATQLEPLSKLPTKNVALTEVFFEIIIAHGALTGLTSNSLFSPYLRSSWQLGHTLLTQLAAYTKIEDLNHEVGQYELIAIRNSYEQYKTALLAEFGSLDSFFVTQKGGFDTFTLLTFGENLFPIEMSQKAPDAIFDAREGSKCLAYEIPTAAGFHIFRATETVLRRYYSQVTGGAPHPKVRSLGVYIAALLRAQKGDVKVIAALKQMNELHRNPLIHPEVVLTTDEAIAIFGIARSAITAMLAVLQQVPPTTQIAPSA